MKKAKKSIVVCAVLALIFAISACGGTAAQGVNNPDSSTFTIEEIQGNPAYYVGNITLIGIAGNSNVQGFVLQNETGTFEILVEYRGSQALPQVGDKISVEGRLTANRPCCGPGFTITSTQFETVE